MTNYQKGIDVSQWQGSDFNFDAAYADGYRFALIRASVRVSMDPEYLSNVQRARDAGFLTGTYHYIYQSTPAANQAWAYVAALEQGQGQLDYWGAWLDVEENDLAWGHLVEFWTEFGALWQNFPIGWRQQGYPESTNLGIYTSQSKWGKVSGKPADLSMNGTPLWVADWGEGRTEPRLPTGWDDWLFWQWTSKGQVAGYTGNVDLNHGKYTLKAGLTPTEPGPCPDIRLLNAQFHISTALLHLDKAQAMVESYQRGDS